jgi:hypothetical protein
LAEYIKNIPNDLMNQSKLSSRIFQSHFVAVDAAIMEVKKVFFGGEKKTSKIHSICCVIYEDI